MPIAALLLASAFLAQTPPPAQAVDPAQARLQAIRELRNPAFDETKAADDGYWKAFQADLRKAIQARGALILAFFKDYPNHAEAAPLMELRWSELEGASDATDARAAVQTALADVEAVLQANPPKPVQDSGLYWRAAFRIRLAPDFGKAQAEADVYISQLPEERRRAVLLLAQTAYMAPDLPNTILVYRRIVKDFGDMPEVGMYAGLLRRLEALGKPFGFKFKDLTTGKDVDTSAWKGKVVLIDFFFAGMAGSSSRATLMKMLRSELGPKGLEIVGIAMDLPKDPADPASTDGRQKAVEFVSANKVAWPIHWAGPDGERDWAVKWGIFSFPTAFIVDRQGVLRFNSEPVNLKGELEKLLGG